MHIKNWGRYVAYKQGSYTYMPTKLPTKSSSSNIHFKSKINKQHWTSSGGFNHEQGRWNEFYLGVAQIIRKMKFCEFSKFLLYISPILEVALATPVLPPLLICTSSQESKASNFHFLHNSIHSKNRKRSLKDLPLVRMLRHLLIFLQHLWILAFIVAFECRFFHKNCSEGNNEQLLFYSFLLFCLFTELVNRIPVHRDASALYIVTFRELLLSTSICIYTDLWIINVFTCI